jgi:hypothetical protein
MPYLDVAWEILITDECKAWYDSLSEEEQDSVVYAVGLLEEKGPQLRRPYADVIHGSRYINMKELRVQHDGRPYRVLFIFDPERNAVLLIGGDKTGNHRWYEEFVPKADAIYTEYLAKTR